MKYKENNNTIVPFNQAQLFVERLDNLEGMIDELISNNEIRLAFDLLLRVYVRIRPIVKQRNLDKINELNEEISEEINKLNAEIYNLNIELNSSAIKKKFFELDKKMWELQHSLELVLPKKISKPWEQEIEEDFL